MCPIWETFTCYISSVIIICTFGTNYKMYSIISMFMESGYVLKKKTKTMNCNIYFTKALSINYVFNPKYEQLKYL